jgi:RNA polymerase sigma-70 factor, ECF subfamily
MRPEVGKAIEVLHDGSPHAVERALGLLQRTIFSFSMKVCGHREDAEDTMQETLLQTVSKLSKFDSPKALALWLYKVAKTRCLMSRRHSKFAPKKELSIEVLMPDRRELEELASPESSPERTAMAHESAETLQKAVLQLPPAYRLVLVLHDMEGLSTAEVAQVTGLSEGNVRVRLHRARVFVRNKLMKASATRTPKEKAASAHPRHCKELFAQLSDFLDERLDDTKCEEVERHLDGCRPCRMFLASLERTVEQLRSHRFGHLDAHRATSVRAKILRQYGRALESARPH